MTSVGRAGRRARSLAQTATLLLGVAVVLPGAAAAQSDPLYNGSPGLAWAGGAIGAYSGATMGLGAGLVPCSYRTTGTNCARIAAGLGSMVGASAGAIIGARDQDLMADKVGGMVWGLGIGAGVGWALRGTIRHYGFTDAGAGALVGGAIGAAPHGSAIGFAAGAAVGAALWAIFPSVEVADAVGLSLLGLALGGLGQWTYDAVRAGNLDAGSTDITLFLWKF
jgi:hypothetical protein